MTNQRVKRIPDVPDGVPAPEVDTGPDRVYTFRSASGETTVHLELDTETGGGTITYDRAGHRVDTMLVPEEPR